MVYKLYEFAVRTEDIKKEMCETTDCVRRDKQSKMPSYTTMLKALTIAVSHKNKNTAQSSKNGNGDSRTRHTTTHFSPGTAGLVVVRVTKLGNENGKIGF